jgi:hypothetical protein
MLRATYNELKDKQIIWVLHRYNDLGTFWWFVSRACVPEQPIWACNKSSYFCFSGETLCNSIEA